MSTSTTNESVRPEIEKVITMMKDNFNPVVNKGVKSKETTKGC